VSDTRYLPVPDALVGERADVALARMLGMSRTKAAELLDGGGVSLEGFTVGRSDTVRDGILAIDIPQPRAAMPEPTIPGGLTVVYEDADIAVIDKPWASPRIPHPAGRAPLSPVRSPMRE